jgi:hypothetical protein
MRYAWLIIAAAALAACHAQKEAATPAASLTVANLTTGEPHLLLLTGSISYDSLKATYSFEPISQKLVDGYINIVERGGMKNLKELHYVQLDGRGTVISMQPMDNPLLRDVEYHGDNGYEHKVSRLTKAVCNLRIQLDRDAQQVELRHGETTFYRLIINQ